MDKVGRALFLEGPDLDFLEVGLVLFEGFEADGPLDVALDFDVFALGFESFCTGLRLFLHEFEFDELSCESQQGWIDVDLEYFLYELIFLDEDSLFLLLNESKQLS